MGTTDNTYLEQHVRAFNATVDNGDWGPFVERFTDDAVPELVGPPVGPFIGREAIADAYAQSPPDDRIDVSGPGEIHEDRLIVPYEWRATGATGTMRYYRHGDRITRLVATFD